MPGPPPKAENDSGEKLSGHPHEALNFLEFASQKPKVYIKYDYRVYFPSYTAIIIENIRFI
jgi:hypothetical protein